MPPKRKLDQLDGEKSEDSNAKRVKKDDDEPKAESEVQDDSINVYYSYEAKRFQDAKLSFKCGNCKCKIGRSKHPGPFSTRDFTECALCSLILCNDYRLCEDEEAMSIIIDRVEYTICGPCADDFEGEDDPELIKVIRETVESRQDESKEPRRTVASLKRDLDKRYLKYLPILHECNPRASREYIISKGENWRHEVLGDWLEDEDYTEDEIKLILKVDLKKRQEFQGGTSEIFDKIDKYLEPNEVNFFKRTE